MIVAKLTDKQRRFCEEYIVDLNATQAAIRAEYSEKTAYSMGQRLLKKVEAQEYIKQLKEERAARTQIEADRVIYELSLIAFSNAADYAAVVEREMTVEVDGHHIKLLDDDGNPIMYRTVEPVLTKDLTAEQKRALAVIKKGRDGFEVRPYDKVRALELLGKHIGLFEEKVNVNGTINNPMEGLTTEDLKKLIEDG